MQLNNLLNNYQLKNEMKIFFGGQSFNKNFYSFINDSYFRCSRTHGIFIF